MCDVRYANSKGFTLMEILIVVVVMGILAAIVIQRLTKADLYNKYLVYTTAHRIAGDLRLARRLAVTTTDKHRVNFSKVDGSGDYNQYILERKNGSWVQVGETKSIPDDVVVSGDGDIEFDSDGTADDKYTFNYVIGSHKYRIKIKEATGRALLESY